MDVLVEGGYIATQDAQRRLIVDGAVAIRDDRIIAVGPRAEVEPLVPRAERIDAREHLVLPGLIDAHVHLHTALCRGLLDDIACVPWIVRMFSWYYPWLDEEKYYTSALLCCLDMMKSGTTTFCDCGTTPGIEAGAMRAATESGLRGVLGRVMMDIYDPPALTGMPARLRETTEQALARGEAFLTRYARAADGRLRPWLSLQQVPNASDALCRGAAALTQRHGVGLLTHAAVTEPMVEMTRARFGHRDIERFAALGLLGPRFVSAHVGWVTEEEVTLLAEHGAPVVHIPGSSMHGAYGSVSRGRIPEMVAQGVTVALGCDGAACGNHVDMVRQLYLAATAHKEARLDPVLFSAQHVLDMATIHGARALGWEADIGSLEPGKKADLILLDLRRPEWAPYHPRNVISNLVYSATGDSVDTVIVDGRVLMAGRHVRSIDEPAVLERAQALLADLLRTEPL